MMRDPAGAPVWLQIVTLIVWMIALGVYVERNRYGGSADQRAHVKRLTAERDRLRAELEQRRRSAMPTVTTERAHDELARDVDRRLRLVRTRVGA